MALQVRGNISKKQEITCIWIGVLVLVGLWCLLTYGGFVKSLFLPNPSEVLDGLLHFNKLGWLVPAIWHSFLRVAIALGLVVVIGTPLGILMGAYRPFDAMFIRIFNSLKAIPPTGLISLIILWFSVEEKAKVIFLFMGAIFYMILQVRTAVLAVREDYLVVARDIGANSGQIMKKVLIPAAMPQIFESIIICNGIMWTYIVLAEFINSTEEQIGLGFLLQIGSRTFQSGQVYGTLILIGLIAYATEWCLRQIQSRYFTW